MSPATRSPRRGAAAERRRFAPVFAALGDETRLTLVAELAEGGELSITRLTDATRLTRQAVTKHLRVLERARIVRSSREGRESRFRLDPAPLLEAGEYARVVSQGWDRALSRLKAFVER